MVIINDNGPRLTESQVADLESRIGLPLSDDYRRFLLENNGGTPTPDVINVNGIQGSETDLQIFFGIDRDIEAHNIEWRMHIMSDRVGRPLMPIARDSGDNVFFSRCQGMIATASIIIIFGARAPMANCISLQPASRASLRE